MWGARRRRKPSQSFQARSAARLVLDMVESHSTAFLAALETVEDFSGTCCEWKESSRRRTVVACIRKWRMHHHGHILYRRGVSEVSGKRVSMWQADSTHSAAVLLQKSYALSPCGRIESRRQRHGLVMPILVL